MSDEQIHHILEDLADAIREVPAGDKHQAIVDRFFALLAYLESEELIGRYEWHLSSRART
jgi:hypothetical protein